MSNHARRSPQKEKPRPVNMTPGPPNGYDPIAAAQQHAAQQAMLQQLQQQAVALQLELDQLQEANAQAIVALQQKGLAVNPAEVLEARISMLVDEIAKSLGPQGVLWGLRVNLAYERRMHATFEQLMAQSTQAQLSMGGVLTPQQIRELAKQTKTFGG